MNIEGPGWEMQQECGRQRWDEEQAELTRDYDQWLNSLPEPWWGGIDQDPKWIQDIEQEYEKCQSGQ